MSSSPHLDIDDALGHLLCPGQLIVVGQSWGAPRASIAALARHADKLRGSTLFVGMLIDDLPELPETAIRTFFPSGPLGTEAALRVRRAVYENSSLFDVADAFRRRELVADVAIAQASTPRDGLHSLGISVDFVHAAVTTARACVLEINERVPFTGDRSVVRPEGDCTVVAGGLPATVERRSSQRDVTIARNLADWIPDGATLQLGMAPFVGPLAAALGERRGLRVHTGLVGDWVWELDRAGALDRGHQIVATGAGGSLDFYQSLDGNQRVEMVPADVTHSPSTLRELPLLRAINSVFDIALTGDVNCEIGADGRRNGVAGLRDFAHAAAGNPSGLSIIAIAASTTSRSRIVEQLAHASSLHDNAVDVVVTEHGSADMRGLPPNERALRLVDIADPQYRTELRRAVNDRFPLRAPSGAPINKPMR